MAASGQVVQRVPDGGVHEEGVLANGTMCAGCWVAADPEARGCPGCQKSAQAPVAPRRAVRQLRGARRPSRPSARRGARSSRSCAKSRASRKAPPTPPTPPLARATPCSTSRTTTSRTWWCGAAISGRARAPCAGAPIGDTCPRHAQHALHRARRRPPVRRRGHAPGPRLTSRALRRGPGTCSPSSARSTACPNPSGRGRAAAWAACSGSSRRTRPSRCTCARRT